VTVSAVRIPKHERKQQMLLFSVKIVFSKLKIVTFINLKTIFEYIFNALANRMPQIAANGIPQKSDNT